MVSNEEGRRLLAEAQPEDSLLWFTRDAALANHWLFYHTYRSDRSDKGFYDVVAIHPEMMRVVVAELKSVKGRTTDEQKVWAAAARTIASAWAGVMPYRDFGHPIQTALYPNRTETWPLAYYEWRPTKQDKDEIMKVFEWRR